MTNAAEILSHVRLEPSGCWVWLRSLTNMGYGQVNFNGQVRLVHRILYEHCRGAIPKHLELDHLCRNRACCNPTHLDLVSHRENVLRGASLPARLAQATHCIAGHEFTPDNTIHVQGGRRCRECKNRRDREYRRKRFGLLGNAQARKTHCPHGHEYNAQNTYVHNGRRQCRACMIERARLRQPSRWSTRPR